MNEVTTNTSVQLAQAAPQKAQAQLQVDGHGVMAIIPRNLNEAMKYANGLAHSGIVPDSFRFDGKKASDVNVSLVAMGVLKVLEIGMAPQIGLGFLLPINGRFTVWGDGAWALIQRNKHLSTHTVEWVGPEGFDPDTTALPLNKWPLDFGCIVTLWRVGQDDPYVGSYTVGRAIRAGMWNNSYKKPWITDPARMLFNRARSYAMRDGFADDLCGLGIAEEVMDYTDAPKGSLVDNSALDDNLPALPAPTATGISLADQVLAYISGLAAVPTLSALMEYQGLPNNQALAQILQKENEEEYGRMIAANARRYAEIEVGDRAAEEKADAERGKETDQ